ncbi:MAG TPA: DUF4382 domain-containing protein [Nitrospirota bacterium]|nr:DUF4382 domain-containing protein [Nitrospirota bacterium]
MKRWSLIAFVVVLFSGLSIFLAACGGSGSSSIGGTASQGTVNMSVTDAPGDYDHVYITVKDAWFNTSDVADPRAADWHKIPLAAPVTVDLMSLSNGQMQAIWSNINLTVGAYRQIRLFLVPTYASNPPAGHQYYNEVVIGSLTYPLYIPDPDHGIQIIGTFTVSGGGRLKLAFDFDAGEDIVEFHDGVDYILKPRMKYFDLDNAGAIIGKLSSTGTFTTASHYVIKAERLATAAEMLATGSTGTYHVIRRWTVPNTDGTFILYPVSTLETNTWDVVIRGENIDTLIIKGVPITKGATPASGATDLGTIITTPTTTPNNDYMVAGTIGSPTGAWVQFYQTLPGSGEYPYEIRFRHFNPLWGGFHQTFMLNDDQVQVGTFVSSGATLTFTSVTPANGIGTYDAVAGALMYQRSASTVVTSATTTVPFTTLSIISSYSTNTVTGNISLGTDAAMQSMMLGQMNSGLLFAVQGGMVVNTLNSINSTIDNQMSSGGSYQINLPGGYPGAFYGIDAVAWEAPLPSIYKAIAIPQIVDLRTGNDTANMQMLPLW